MSSSISGIKLRGPTPSEILSFSDGAYFQLQSGSYWTDTLKHSPLMGRGWPARRRLTVSLTRDILGTYLLTSTTKILERLGNLFFSYFQLPSLTNSQDTLPAIAGVAEKLCVANQIGYVAGLLDLNVDWGLMWSRRNEALVRISDPYIAPTWSWASYRGPITISDYEDTTLCEIEDVCLDFVQPGNIYGQLKAGFIAIAAVEIQLDSGISNWDSTNLYAEAHDISLRTSTRTHRLVGTQMRLILDEVCLIQDLTKATFAVIFGGIDGEVHGLILAPPEGIEVSC
ncbi:hypothetical protein IFR05_005765 [Cadophora sp. M221]|nr:hypothetical protein IFR05_005765 [Cadophora sp. M221]